MTVKEMIGHLKRLPQDAILVFGLGGDCQEVKPHMISLIEPRGKTGLLRFNGRFMFLEEDGFSVSILNARRNVRKFFKAKIDDPYFFKAVHLKMD